MTSPQSLIEQAAEELAQKYLETFMNKSVPGLRYIYHDAFIAGVAWRDEHAVNQVKELVEVLRELRNQLTIIDMSDLDRRTMKQIIKKALSAFKEITPDKGGDDEAHK